MPTLVERYTAVAIVQHQCDDVPSVSVETATVQEDNRMTVAAPVEIVKAHRADDQLMVLREIDLARVQAGDFDRFAQHLELSGPIHWRAPNFMCSEHPS
jgi:hypothetical protein